MILVLLFIVGVVTGFVGTNVGGSALMTVPIMIWLGISPQSAVASSRVASLGTMLGGLRQFHRTGKVDYKLGFKASILGVIGAVLGAYLLTNLPANIVEKVIGVLTLVLLLTSLLRKKIKFITTSNPLILQSLGYLFFLFAGLLSGFFGGGAIIVTLVFLLCFGKSISESVGTRKVNGLLVNFAAIFTYWNYHIINWEFSIALILGTLIGSTLGAKYAIKKGDRWMEYLFNIVVIGLAIKLLI